MKHFLTNNNLITWAWKIARSSALDGVTIHVSNKGVGKEIDESDSLMSMDEMISAVGGIGELLPPTTSSLQLFNLELMLFKLCSQHLHKSPRRVSESLPAPIH